MGICATDIYDQIKNKYQSQFIKFIVYKNSINYLDQTLQNSKNTLNQKMNKLKSQKINLITSAQNQITQNFIINQKILSQKFPGGIASLQKLKKSKTEQFLGFKFYKQKMSTLKNQTTTKLTQLHSSLVKQMQQIHSFHCNRLKQDQPTLAIYNQLPVQVQKSILKKGTVQFKQQVQKSQSQIKRSLKNMLDAEYHVQKINNILPQESIDGVVNLAKEKFQNIKDGLITGGINVQGIF